MKAILVREFGSPDVLKLEEVPTPKPAAGEVLVGTPAFEVSAFWRAIAVFKKLGDLPKRIRALEKRLDEIEKPKSD